MAIRLQAAEDPQYGMEQGVIDQVSVFRSLNGTLFAINNPPRIIAVLLSGDASSIIVASRQHRGKCRVLPWSGRIAESNRASTRPSGHTHRRHRPQSSTTVG